MADRRFQLPGIHELSKEQEAVRAWPLEGRFLLTGGPGTGKSVMCLLRARRLHDQLSSTSKNAAKKSPEYVFLVFNHLLMMSSKQLFGVDLSARQWQSWFEGVFKEATGKPLPKLAPPPRSAWRPTDWESACEMIRERSPNELQEKFQHLSVIIDEGQDMPVEFYQCLNELGIDNLFVAADFNQSIGHENCSYTDLLDAIQPDKEHRLASNYRNKYAIARLAQEFYTGDPSAKPPELPEPPIKMVRRPVFFRYVESKEERLLKRVMMFCDRYPRKLIGILTPNDASRSRLFNGLRDSGATFENGKPLVSTFSSRERNEIDFGQGGVVIINAQACKGLEFDVVFLFDLNEYHYRHEFEVEKKSLFYVMVARAVDQVFLLAGMDKDCPIEAILPIEENILERKP